jgi:hypothetical protein
MIRFDLNPKIGSKLDIQNYKKNELPDKGKNEKEKEKEKENEKDEGARVSVKERENENENDRRKNTILDEMIENFNLTKEYSKAGVKVPRGDDNWYKHCGVAMKKMSKDYPNSKDYLLQCLVAHMIELLLFEEKLQLMNYIYSLNEIEMNSVEYFLKEYFERKSISTKNFSAMILYKLNKIKIMILDNKGNKQSKWIEAEPEDQREIAETSEVRELLNFKVNDYNNVVGFLGYEKNNKYLIFKTKDMLSQRDTGARCDEAGKNKTIQILNKILGEEKYTKENTKIMKDDKKNVSQDAIGHIELCVMQEFILRYFDRIKKNDKKWFLSPEMALYFKLYTIHLK